jgi:hypothetical protein
VNIPSGNAALMHHIPLVYIVDGGRALGLYFNNDASRIP